MKFLPNLNRELFEILTRDPQTNLLSEDKIMKATDIIKRDIVQVAERTRQGRKIIEVIQIKPGQITTYKQKEAEALYRTKDGKFERVKSGTTSMPLTPYPIKISQLIPNEWIEDQIPVYGFFDNLGRSLAVKEDKDIVETIFEAADVVINASTPGNLTLDDVTSARGKIEFSRHAALIAHPLDMADLRKDIRRPLEDVLKMLEIRIMERPYLPEGTALVLDTQRYSVALFERRPITVRLFDDPLHDGVGIITTQRYVPIVLDCNKVVKINNC